MSLADDREALARLTACLSKELSGVVEIVSLSMLSGGAIQENWAIDLIVDSVPLAAVLRTDSPTGVAVSLSRGQEYQLLKAAWDAGVCVPEPLACVSDLSVIGKEFCLMRRVSGTAIGQRITRDMSLGGDREALTERMGREMARIHSITPKTHHFDFLPEAPQDPATTELQTLRSHFDALQDADRPVYEWTFRWLEARKPDPEDVVLAHHDFRTGNYMVDDKGLTAILDWEFAGWSDPMEDIGWFCAMCWRFSGRDKPAGGIGSREALYRGYESESGRKIDAARVQYWEVYAHLRWAVIALQQGARYQFGGEKTLDLGLTGRRPAEIELELLRMTELQGEALYQEMGTT